MRKALSVATIALLLAVVHSHGDHEHNFGEAADVGDEAHIRSHMEDKIDLPQHLDEAHSRFFYFEMTDLNRDNAIDGIEILKMMTHAHGKGSREPGNPVADEDAMMKRIDQTLADMDYNGDGVVHYSEFSKYQESHHGHVKTEV